MGFAQEVYVLLLDACRGSWDEAVLAVRSILTITFYCHSYG